MINWKIVAIVAGIACIALSWNLGTAHGRERVLLDHLRNCSIELNEVYDTIKEKE